MTSCYLTSAVNLSADRSQNVVCIDMTERDNINISDSTEREDRCGTDEECSRAALVGRKEDKIFYRDIIFS